MNNEIDTSKACVGIAALIGGISVGIVALVTIFSPEQLAVAGWLVASLCLMGSALGYFTTRRRAG